MKKLILSLTVITLLIGCNTTKKSKVGVKLHKDTTSITMDKRLNDSTVKHLETQVSDVKKELSILRVTVSDYMVSHSTKEVTNSVVEEFSDAGVLKKKTTIGMDKTTATTSSEHTANNVLIKTFEHRLDSLTQAHDARVQLYISKYDSIKSLIEQRNKEANVFKVRPNVIWVVIISIVLIAGFLVVYTRGIRFK